MTTAANRPIAAQIGTRAARDAVMGDNAQKTLETEDSAVQDFL